MGILSMAAMVPATAGIIYIADGDSFTVNVSGNDTYVFTGGLSASNPIYSFGVILSQGETFDVSLQAPSAFSLSAGLNSGQDFTGSIFALPNSSATIAAGGQWQVTVDGSFNVGETNWFAITTDSSNFPTIDAEYGGLLSIADTLAGTESIDMGNGGSGEESENENGGGTVEISEPGIQATMLLGFAALMFLTRRRKCPSEARKVCEFSS